MIKGDEIRLENGVVVVPNYRLSPTGERYSEIRFRLRDVISVEYDDAGDVAWIRLPRDFTYGVGIAQARKLEQWWVEAE